MNIINPYRYPNNQLLCKYALNGTTKYISYGDILDSVFASANPQFTIERWIKLKEIGRTQNIFGKWTASGNQRSFNLQLNAANKLVWYQSELGDTTIKTHTQDTTLTDVTNRTHIAVVVDYSQATFNLMIKIYINGDLITTTPSTGVKGLIFSSSASFIMGTVNGATTDFANIDDYGVVVSSRVKNAAEILGDYNNGNGAEPSATGLELYSDFKTDTFSTNWTVKDLSVNNLDGTTVNVLEGDHTCEQVEILEDVI